MCRAYGGRNNHVLRTQSLRTGLTSAAPPALGWDRLQTGGEGRCRPGTWLTEWTGGIPDTVVDGACRKGDGLILKSVLQVTRRLGGRRFRGAVHGLRKPGEVPRSEEGVRTANSSPYESESELSHSIYYETFVP